MNWFAMQQRFTTFDYNKPHSSLLKSIYTAVLILFTLVAAAQEPRHYNFTHYTPASGLISYQINSCVQDDQGYIWVATNDGLQRYDGIRYKNFRYDPANVSSVPPQGISQVLFDKNNNMWIMSNEGKVGVFDRKTFTFFPAMVKLKDESLLQTSPLLKRLIADEYGNVFLLFQGKELVTYNKEKNEFSALHNFFPLKKGWAVTNFIQQPGTKKYWICVKDTGFVVFNAVSKKLSIAGNNSEQEKIIEQYKNTKPYKIFFDSRGRFWFAGLGDGFPYISCYDLKRNEPVLEQYNFNASLKTYHEINHFLEQKDGTIWITGVIVFAKYIEPEKKFEPVYNGYVDDRSIDYIRITNFIEDRENNLWVATAGNGLFRFNPATEFFKSILHFNPLNGKKSDAAPVTFIHDKDGSVLTGYWGENMLRYNNALQEIPLGIKGFPAGKTEAITEMCYSADSNFIWMAPMQGLYKYDVQKRSVQYFNLPLLKSRIREMQEDSKGRLWLGLQEDGVFKFDPSKGKDNFENGLTKVTTVDAARINKILVDKKGYVWVGTFAQGAYVIDPETEKVLIRFDQKAAGAMMLPEQTVTSVFEFNDSIIIIGTSSRLIVYNRYTQKLQQLSTPEIFSGTVSAIEKDKNGYLWVATTTGLYRVSVPGKVFVKFDRLDGIRNDYFVNDASYTLPDGRLLLGSTGTMIALNPPDIKINTSFPEVHITDFKVMNQSVRLDSLLQQKIIELGADENSITIDLSTLSYNTGYLLQYKLEGLDKNWKTADKTQQLIYNYLPPGKYTLLVNTIDANGKKGAKPLELAIKITPPFWRTWWFYSLLFLLVGVLFFWLDRERMKRKEAVQQMRSSIAGKLHQEVSVTLSNINVLSEMARLKADKEPQKSKEFIEQIHGKSSTMIDSIDDMLWAISPENDSMEKVIDRLKEHLDVLRSSFDVTIDLLVDPNVELLNLNMKQRQDIFWLLKRGSTNTSRTGAANIKMHLSLEKSTLVYTLEFDNSNMDMQQFTNLVQRQELADKLKEVNGVFNMKTVKEKSVIELKVNL